MYKMFRNASFERKTYDWEEVWGQGPIGKERFPDMSIKMSKYATEVVDFTVSGVEENRVSTCNFTTFPRKKQSINFRTSRLALSVSPSGFVW